MNKKALKQAKKYTKHVKDLAVKRPIAKKVDVPKTVNPLLYLLFLVIVLNIYLVISIFL